jgi:hypothetical protein
LVASLLIASQLVTLGWTIVPASGGLTPGGAILAAAFLGGALALFTNRFARISRLTEAQP